MTSLSENTVDFRNHRIQLYQWLRRCLIGPGKAFINKSEDFDLVGINPVNRYHTGILFPVVKGESGIDPLLKDDDEDTEDEDIHVSQDGGNDIDKVKPLAKRSRYIPPSSVGFSFYIQGKNIKLNISPWAVKYHYDLPCDEKKRDEKGRYQKEPWQRIPLSQNNNFCFSPSLSQEIHSQRTKVFENSAEIFVLWRPHHNGWLVTVSLSNCQELPNELKPDELKCFQTKLSLFEVELECSIEEGEVGVYPRVDPSLLSEEEQELELQYKHKKIYAVGHGAAVEWNIEKNRVNKIWSDFMPKVEVPQVTADVSKVGEKILDIEYLSNCRPGGDDIFHSLEKFIMSYEEWITEQRRIANNLSTSEQEIANRIISRMDEAVKRMKSGVTTLKADVNAAKAFGFANKAMVDQMKRYDMALAKSSKNYRWRPFQLAFLLMAIESTVHEDSDFRDMLDLIWFPTGGGKTEAYLGLIAFLILYRRLQYPSSGGGVTVLMRYTLRLLTQQQFQRAARIICALELIRQKHSEFGTEPVSVGLWVGEATSPNTFDAAYKLVGDAVKKNKIPKPPLKLVLDCCPWCRKKFDSIKNYQSSQSEFLFRCTNKDCAFGEKPLPCNVVDEALYQNPPSLLIATIDKFARFAWDERTTVFFGHKQNRPPELIIQDELHLISGALGSIAGLYEAAIDTVLTLRGVRPKYIASTATISMVKEQVKRLYGRDVSIFPPPGLTSDDSFFSRAIPLEEKPGRLYIGYLAPNLNRQYAMAPLAAAILAAPHYLFSEDRNQDVLLDAWWTMVAYHGSLKGVGNSHNSLNINVPNYLSRYIEEISNVEKRESNEIKSGIPRSKLIKERLQNLSERIVQMTSISTAEENSRTFARLEKKFGDHECLDAVLATIMISVGVDVERLALMIINGQPLTTAEYIQASSRVGRGSVPGIVIANYYREQARSLSHYECFRPYHESFYRFVEPSSVTPYTYQARMRALHAALVIVMRHTVSDLTGNECAKNFDPTQDKIKNAIKKLEERCVRGSRSSKSEIVQHIHSLAEQWKNEVFRCQRNRRMLVYQAPTNSKNQERLLFNHDDRIKGLWATLQSMRNVENTAILKLL